MLIINGLQMYTTKEGYIVTIQKIKSANEGITCTGEIIETVIGHRPVITLTTNQMLEKEAKELFKILMSNDKVTVNYPLPYGTSNRAEQEFNLSSDINALYKHMRHKKMAPMTITLTGVLAEIVEV